MEAQLALTAIELYLINKEQEESCLSRHPKTTFRSRKGK